MEVRIAKKRVEWINVGDIVLTYCEGTEYWSRVEAIKDTGGVRFLTLNGGGETVTRKFVDPWMLVRVQVEG